MNKIIALPPNRVWRTYVGGKMLAELNQEGAPADSHFPEDWIASVTRAINPGREHLEEEGLSKVKFNGQSVIFKQLLEQHPEYFLGEEHFQKYGSHTAFLLKFLDSAIRLHLQCHPTIAFAQQYLNSNHGKTEGYYILGTRDDVPEPYIYLGFQKPPSLPELKRAVEEQDIAFLESCFEKVPVRKGDAFYVPGGLPHAIGEGIFMIEIMEPTDLVARIEFEKAGYVLPEKARFMERGIDFGLSMFNLSALPVQTIRQDYFMKPRVLFENELAKEEVIFDDAVTNCFRMNRLEVKGQYQFSKPGFYIAIVTEGAGQLQVDDEIMEARFGDKFFIPAAAESLTVNAPDGMTLVLAMPPA
ncbi:class I mannose-6-phosphate isomerase [Adhaeribacter aquaticus]|uniref:class I mannose-6-phosphate isomerase n=1 Tax=Adhaeribacter aquaticus TaxID=299567 RepID=UPI0003F755C5|nr:class I mannose-6-phosphate isomerase [Adhaeribacter aquaticus]